MKIRHYIYIALTMLMVGCTDEEEILSPAQSDLIGKAVNFNASIADPFATRTSYNHNGKFNEEDEMTIYRQYSEDYGVTFENETAYRVYELKTKLATGTSIVLETDWKPKEGAVGFDPPSTYIDQHESDSLTWENGKTVRFRSWSRSNLSGALKNGSKALYYPDYCVSDWVTVSGPTKEIPMTLKHQGCRIGFSQKSGNELQKAEICLTPEDYMWEDNSTTAEKDEADKWADASAKAAAVKAVYDKMCMPAGVDINTSLLKTITTEKYNALTDFKTITTLAEGIVAFNTQAPENIANSVQRPVFTSNLNNRLYMISIPYDMSTAETRGETLILPPYTRFKIWLYDVNSGDQGSDGLESNYHIFSLSDIKKNDQPLFPDGLELKPGYSYVFSVGYHYDSFTITPADDFSWDEQTDIGGSANNDAKAKPTSTVTDYTWWKNAIAAAIPTGSEDYKPVFHITNEKEFLEFINLVNGTTGAKTSGLTMMLDPTQTYTAQRPATNADYLWYKDEDIEEVDGVKKVKEGASPATDADKEGYLFYQHYHPMNANQPAYTREDYLRGPFSFYDESLMLHFTVKLTADLDLKDWILPTIGNAEYLDENNKGNPFLGLFNGQMHTIKNIYMQDEYMFGYCGDAGISNLKIETTHNFKLLNSAKPYTSSGYGVDLIGISIKAPSTGNPLAKSLTGSSYVVGCIYEGKAGGAMIGEADNLFMYGNMMAASGLASGSGALLGQYKTGSTEFFKPQTTTNLKWGRFMANYYDITKSPGTIPVGGHAEYSYRPQEYIRGSESYILKAKNDNLLTDEVSYSSLSATMKAGYYGWAPWKAMNYAIYRYITDNSSVNAVMPCNAHFVSNTVGYDNCYPTLTDTAPTTEEYGSLNILKLNN